MGTSNWHNILFCIEVLMKIEPRQVLDVGVGFGRWGIIVREFCDVWFGRVLREEWNINIEGIEAFPANIDEYHKSFYNKIHLGDAKAILPTLKNQWDVIIFGDVLEHFERSLGEKILRWSIDHSSYVLVNVPLGVSWSQDDKYGNLYERHLSSWEASDFINYSLCRQALFLDYILRPFGSFVLSKNDPREIHDKLFSELNVDQNNNQLSTSDKNMLLANIHALSNELDSIKNSRSFRIVQRMKHSPIGKILHYAAAVVMPAPKEIQKGPIRKAPSLITEKKISFSPEETAWIEHQRKTRKPIAICNPEWRGILSSTNELFDEIFFLKDDLDQETGDHFAHLLNETKCPAIVIQGFPLTFLGMVKSLHKLAPKLPIFIIWHGSFIQSKEDYNWTGFQTILQLQKDGDVFKIGFVKQGMAEILAKSGYRTGFVMNRVRRIPEAPSIPLDGGPHIGIWSVPDWGWRKPPYAMLAATTLLSNVTVYSHHVSPRAKDFASILKINMEGSIDAVAQSEMPYHLSKMHLNLNVTLSECAPMLPLESLSVGVPCLFGPTSYYFKDHDYLHQRLIVPYPEDALCIAEYAQRALDERDEIIKAYKKYAPAYNDRAIKSLEDFLEMPLQSTQ